MRQAADAAVAGIDAAVRAVAVGATENDLAAAMLHGATKAGSEHAAWWPPAAPAVFHHLAAPRTQARRPGALRPPPTSTATTP